MKRTLKALLATTVLLASSLTFAADLVLISLADIHSAYMSLPRVLSAVKQVVTEHPNTPSYILVNGDVFEPGNVVAARSGGEIEWAFLEQLDAIAPVILNLGNHEFDFLAPEAFVKRAEEVGLTLIGNIVSRKTGELVAPAVTTIEVAEQTIDLVGLAPNEINTYTQDVRASLVLGDPVAWTEHLGPLTVLSDYVIVLSHAGVVADRTLAPQLPANTLLLIGAHDHLVLEEELELATGGEVLYLHSGFKGEQLAMTEISFANGATLNTNVVILDENVPADPDLVAQIKAAQDAYLTSEDTAIIGTVSRNYSVLEAAQWSVETLRQAVDADVALLNHTSFGAGLDQGPLPKHKFDEFLRFDNDVMVAEVDGATLAGILALANQDVNTPLLERTGDFVYATPFTPEPDKTYKLVTSSWVALPFNIERYLGTSDISFEKVADVTTKGILANALAD